MLIKMGLLSVMVNESTAANDSARSRRVREKWGVSADLGFQAVPDVLMQNQYILELSATDLVVLLNVLMHWWYAGQKPFPRVTTIAKRMGTTPRTVQRSLTRLTDMDLLRQEQGQRGEDFLDPTPLVERLNEIARQSPELLAQRNTE